jgi:3-dehydroquinate synthase
MDESSCANILAFKHPNKPLGLLDQLIKGMYRPVSNVSTHLTFADVAQPPDRWLAGLAQGKMRLALVDENVLRLHAERLGWLADKPVYAIPSGEEHKTLATAERIWNWLQEQQVDRDAHLLVIGGGVTTDLGAFVASTWKRGLSFSLLPTTLLGMVDAAHGGKTGVDLQGVKNQIGTFALPMAVVVDVAFLQTLPVRQLRSGFAEVLKHALLSDTELWRRLRRHPLEEQYWPDLIRHSAHYKTKITDADPTETGLRKVLNLGHTLGHALESAALALPEPLLHGEAVAAGLWAEAELARQMGLLDERTVEDIRAVLLHFGFRLHFPEVDPAAVLAYLPHDKKRASGMVKFALLRQIGRAEYDLAVPEDILTAVVLDLCSERGE